MANEITPTGAIDGANLNFTFGIAPNVIYVDDIPKQKVSSDGRSINKAALYRASNDYIYPDVFDFAVIDAEEIPVTAGTVLDIPLGAVHRIGNTGAEQLVFIEVACGKYLGEDDIIRIQDDYSR